jgi:hypothetical protein
MANAVTGFLCRRTHLISFGWPFRCRSSKEIAGVFVSLQQSFYSAAELVVSLASPAQKTIALLRHKTERCREDGNIRVGTTVHFTIESSVARLNSTREKMIGSGVFAPGLSK